MYEDSARIWSYTARMIDNIKITINTRAAYVAGWYQTIGVTPLGRVEYDFGRFIHKAIMSALPFPSLTKYDCGSIGVPCF